MEGEHEQSKNIALEKVQDEEVKSISHDTLPQSEREKLEAEAANLLVTARSKTAKTEAKTRPLPQSLHEKLQDEAANLLLTARSKTVKIEKQSSPNTLHPSSALRPKSAKGQRPVAPMLEDLPDSESVQQAHGSSEVKVFVTKPSVPELKTATGTDSTSILEVETATGDGISEGAKN